MDRPIPMTGFEATIFNRSIRECQSQCRYSSVLLQDVSHYNAESGNVLNLRQPDPLAF